MWARIKAKLKGWRTVLFHGFVGSSSAVIATLDYLKKVDFTTLLTPGNAALIGIIVALLGIWLRLITTGPVGSKDDPPDEEPA